VGYFLVVGIPSVYPAGSQTRTVINLSKILLWKCSMRRSPTTVDLQGSCASPTPVTHSNTDRETAKGVFMTPDYGPTTETVPNADSNDTATSLLPLPRRI
ncbi:MAG TPA: hypothetical protein VGI45_22190, partial [Terracidiphilus sp.]